jgi:hypothetical protein
LTGFVAFAAGALGVWAGVAFFADGGRGHPSLDTVVHRELDLSARQNREIETMEIGFAARKTAIEAEMRDATRAISVAVSEDKAYTPSVERAVDRFHSAMGELQHETILHVFEMRAVLTPDQQSRFDAIVRTELVGDAENAQRK